MGGDYYDVIPVAHNLIGLAVADVAGKGVPTALLMANVQAMLKLVARQNPSPTAVCFKLNEMLCRNLPPADSSRSFVPY